VNPEAEIHLTKWNSPCPRDWYLLSRKDGDMSGAESLTLLAWNYAHYNEVFASGDRAALSFTDRSRVFLNSENRTIRIEATDRDILLEYQKVGPPVGSPFDTWISLGAPEEISREEEAKLPGPTFRSFYTIGLPRLQEAPVLR
jgi:hypothetical protein